MDFISYHIISYHIFFAQIKYRKSNIKHVREPDSKAPIEMTAACPLA